MKRPQFPSVTNAIKFSSIEKILCICHTLNGQFSFLQFSIPQSRIILQIFNLGNHVGNDIFPCLSLWGFISCPNWNFQAPNHAEIGSKKLSFAANNVWLNRSCKVGKHCFECIFIWKTTISFKFCSHKLNPIETCLSMANEQEFIKSCPHFLWKLSTLQAFPRSFSWMNKRFFLMQLFFFVRGFNSTSSHNFVSPTL